MKMIIREYWERVDHDIKDANGWNIVVKGDYVQKGFSSFPNGGGWKNVGDFYRNVRRKADFRGRVGTCFFFDLKTYYGIHSYQTVEFEEEP